MHDEYANAMLKLIEKKRAQGQDLVETEVPPRGPAKVIDLMEVLKRSLEQGRKTKNIDGKRPVFRRSQVRNSPPVVASHSTVQPQPRKY